MYYDLSDGQIKYYYITMRTIVTECNFDVMGICETFLNDNVTDNEISYV